MKITWGVFFKYEVQSIESESLRMWLWHPYIKSSYGRQASEIAPSDPPLLVACPCIINPLHLSKA